MKYKFSTYIDKPNRVDMYLSALFEDFSRSYVQKIIDNGQVTVNGEQISKNLKIKPRDEITLTVVIQKLEEVWPEDIPLDIVYEDSDFMVINKDAGINVHPVPGEWGKSGTIVNGVLHHCWDKMPCINWVERPGIVHRLDKDTSWLLMIAKTDSSMREISEVIKAKKVGKYYIAIVAGKVKERKFSIESYIGRDPNDRQKMTAKNPVNPRDALTHVELIDFIDNKYSILRVKLETGRTHQIRVHLASIGYPILWDSKYGNLRVNKEIATRYQLHRQALHAYQLELPLQTKTHHFKGELKEDMKRLVGDKFPLVEGEKTSYWM